MTLKGSVKKTSSATRYTTFNIIRGEGGKSPYVSVDGMNILAMESPRDYQMIKVRRFVCRQLENNRSGKNRNSPILRVNDFGKFIEKSVLHTFYYLVSSLLALIRSGISKSLMAVASLSTKPGQMICNFNPFGVRSKYSDSAKEINAALVGP